MRLSARTALRVIGTLSGSLVILLAGCAGSGNSAASTGGGGVITVTNPLASGGATSVYTITASSTGATSVLTFPATSSGSVNPSVSLPIGSYAQCVATDSSGNVYVGSYTTTGYGMVQVYAAGYTAASTPIRTITGTAATGFYSPVAMATDSSGQLYVIMSNNYIAVFAAGASGSPVPRTFTSTSYNSPIGITVDTAGSMYVVNASSSTASTVLVFASSASGNATPSRSLTVPGFAYGAAVDASLNVWVGVDTLTPSASVVEYAAGASGSATALKTIAGASTTLGSATIGGMRFDAAGNLWLVNQIGVVTGTTTTYNTYVSAWPASATGNQAPTVQFSSAAWVGPSPQFAVK